MVNCCHMNGRRGWTWLWISDVYALFATRVASFKSAGEESERDIGQTKSNKHETRTSDCATKHVIDYVIHTPSRTRSPALIMISNMSTGCVENSIPYTRYCPTTHHHHPPQSTNSGHATGDHSIKRDPQLLQWYGFEVVDVNRP